MATIHGTNLNDIINGTTLADTIFGNGGNDRLLGNGGNDTIRGGSGQDILEGGAGNDVLFADSNEGGEDVLFGGADSDILVSGTGRDFFSGGDGIDAASWQESAFGVVANIGTGRAVSAGVEDTFSLIENLIGSRFNDTLRGDGVRNQLFGGDGKDNLFGEGGDDSLSGAAGDDMLDGGAGRNTMRGGTGVDTADYLALASGIDASLKLRQVLTDDRGDSLLEIEGVRGSNFADRIEGDTFGNRLQGMGGADEIDGGQGNDVLTGGSGGDTFVFKASNLDDKTHDPFASGFDRITDFGAVDRIDLSSHFAATNFADSKAAASQFGTDTHLHLAADTVVIEDVGLSELSPGMFLF